MESIEHITELNGKQMSSISFGELVKQLTGASFEAVYKDYLNKGEGHGKREGNLE